MLTVERLDEGEVSPYLIDVLSTGDELELRGPIGGYFVWTSADASPLLLIAGGSGIVPFRSILRHHAATSGKTAIRLLYSARSVADIIYREELTRFAAAAGVDVHFTLTREWPSEWTGYRRRVDLDLLREVAWSPEQNPVAYVCGPTAFVEAAANALVTLGYDASRIKTERFGPTGR
jgi:ferredoxin-NADP reductase